MAGVERIARDLLFPSLGERLVVAESLSRQQAKIERVELVDPMEAFRSAGGTCSRSCRFDRFERMGLRQTRRPYWEGFRSCSSPPMKARRPTERSPGRTMAAEILVSTSVGQEGIDLHRECRHVIHHDLCWNPATIKQRTGRIDRIGSKVER